MSVGPERTAECLHRVHMCDLWMAERAVFQLKPISMTDSHLKITGVSLCVQVSALHTETSPALTAGPSFILLLNILEPQVQWS